MNVEKVLLVCPGGWDADHLARASRWWDWRHEVLWHGEETESEPASFDVPRFVAETVERLSGTGIAGVASGSDYPGCLVAAAVAGARRLPEPQPAAVLRCSHKYYSRLVQADAAPEATPRFGLVHEASLRDGCVIAHDGAKLEFPLFVKPVKSWFSQYARRVDTAAEFSAFLRSPGLRERLAGFVKPFNQLITAYTDFEYDGGTCWRRNAYRGNRSPWRDLSKRDACACSESSTR